MGWRPGRRGGDPSRTRAGRTRPQRGSAWSRRRQRSRSGRPRSASRLAASRNRAAPGHHPPPGCHWFRFCWRCRRHRSPHASARRRAHRSWRRGSPSESHPACSPRCRGHTQTSCTPHRTHHPPTSTGSSWSAACAPHPGARCSSRAAGCCSRRSPCQGCTCRPRNRAHHRCKYRLTPDHLRTRWCRRRARTVVAEPAAAGLEGKVEPAGRGDISGRAKSRWQPWRRPKRKGWKSRSAR